MLTSLEVTSSQLSPPEIPLAEGGVPNTDPLQVREVTGLGPVIAAITSQQFAQIDGEFLTGATVGKREIGVKFGLNPDWETQTIEELRQTLYSYFMPKTQTTLRFRSTHLPTVEIVGFVESMEPNIFAQDPEIVVTIICPRPDFIAIEPTVVRPEGGIGSEGNVGIISDPQAVTIRYPGNVPAGFELRIETPSDSYTGPFYIITETLIQSGFVFSGELNSDLELQLNTVPGQKYVRHLDLSSGLTTNLLRSVTIDAVWPLLYPGDTIFSVMTDRSIEAYWTLSYFARFGGI